MYLYEPDFEVERGDGEKSFCPLCLVCLNEWEDWRILDRVIDAPAYQDVLTWNGCLPGNSEVPQLLGRSKVKYLLVPAMKKNVDYLLIAKPVAFNHLRIRSD